MVTKVSDGDTVWVTVNGCRREKVRHNRIGAPESDQPYGKAAAERLKELVSGKSVCVVYEDTDRYGRILGSVHLEGNDSLDGEKPTMLNFANCSNLLSYTSHLSHMSQGCEARQILPHSSTPPLIQSQNPTLRR